MIQNLLGESEDFLRKFGLPEMFPHIGVGVDGLKRS